MQQTVPYINIHLLYRYDVPYVYTIEFAESNLKVSSQESTLIISIIGKNK